MATHEADGLGAVVFRDRDALQCVPAFALTALPAPLASAWQASRCGLLFFSACARGTRHTLAARCARRHVDTRYAAAWHGHDTDEWHHTRQRGDCDTVGFAWHGCFGNMQCNA